MLVPYVQKSSLYNKRVKEDLWHKFLLADKLAHKSMKFILKPLKE